MTANSKNAIDKKFELLHERIWRLALLSAAGRAVPIPGTSLLLDTALIQNEINEYKEQFGLDSDSLEKLSQIPGVNQEAIKNELSKKGFDTIVFASVASYVLRLLALYAAAEVTEEFAALIPIVGWFTASGISFITTYKALEYALSTAKEASCIILDYISNPTVQYNANDMDE